MKKIVIPLVVIVVLALGAFWYWEIDNSPEIKVEQTTPKSAQTDWTDNYNMEQPIKVWGEYTTIGEFIAEVRAQIETQSYADICITGKLMAEGLMSEPRTADEELYFELTDKICREYR